MRFLPFLAIPEDLFSFSPVRMPHATLTTEADFFQAYDDHADGLFRHCHLRLNNRERSKELMRAAFQQLWLFIARGNYVDSLRIFLYRELNELIERERSPQLTETSVMQINPSLGFLTRLSHEHRLVCILHYVDGFSSSEIGEIIGGTGQTHDETLQFIRTEYSLPTHV